MITRIIEASARHRGLVLLAVAFAAAGSVWAMRRVHLDAIPDLSDPQVVVFTEWMGRSPTLVEDQVTYPVVTALLGAPRVTDVRGTSMFGMSFVYVLFEEGTDPYWARSRVQELLGTVRDRLPDGVNPRLGPDATGIGWVFQYVLVDHAGTHRLDELRTFQDFTLRYALGSVAGVAEVASIGGFEKQYQVTVDPARLQAYGLTLQDVLVAVRESNGDVGGRVVEMAGREYYVRGLGYVQDVGALENAVVRGAVAGRPPVLVRDVGSVRFGPDIRRGVLDWNGEGEAVGGIVVMRDRENALEVIGRVKARLEELRPGFPPGVDVEVAYDRSGLIERSLETLRRALIEEGLVVALVLMLFLLHLRSALLPILSLPMAVGLSFVPMWLFDVPGTIMSLGGIAIAIGATVDAEIVMVEAAHRKLEHAPPGSDRRQLLAEAAREVTPAIFFSLLIIAVAFLPVFTLTGQAGRLFRPMALTKTFVMLASALLSITFAPALRDLLIRGKIRAEADHPLSRLVHRVYAPFVFVALRNPRSTIALGLMAVLSAVPLGLRLGHEFMPALDEGDLLYMPTTFNGISIEEAKTQLQRQDRVLRSFPEIQSVFGKVGRAQTATDPAPLSMVETTLRLRPRSEWRQVHHERWWSGVPAFWEPLARRFWPDRQPLSRAELVAQLDRAMAFPGWTNAFTPPIKTRIDMLTTGVRTPVGVKILGSNLGDIERIGPALERLLTPIAGTRSVFYERSSGGLYIDIVPDREALARYGLKVADVERLIEAAIGGTPVATTVEGRARFSINVRYPQDLRGDVDRLRALPVPVASGAGGMKDGMGKQGLLLSTEPPRAMYAQNMAGMNATSGAAPATGPSSAASSRALSDAPGPGSMPVPVPTSGSLAPGSARPGPGAATPALAFVPLGLLADVRVAGGPPMVRDEDGRLVGYVYVDVDEAARDVGGWVAEARQVVAAALARGEFQLPRGFELAWTGQYEHLVEMNERMKIAVPLTLLLIALLLYLHFGTVAQMLIVLLSIPFALVGSVWLLWLLDYRLSTAVWVGIIALVGLAAQTGIVMIVYIDHAYEKRRAAGLIRNFDDIVWAHLEGTVQRVRPKLMTVSTMLAGLLPLLWADGSGADVMRRVAAPMIGGLVTSAFLTLEIIPVVYTAWRFEQLLWERLRALDPARLARLQALANVQWSGWLLAVAGGFALLYWSPPPAVVVATGALAALLVVAGLGTYLASRPAAKRLVWPA